jgi:cell division protein FtsZ
MMAPGLVNLDFADIRAVMAEMGKAMMGTGEADGENRAIRAAELAISNPLLEDTSMAGARGLLINITGGDDMTLFEVDQAANRIREEVDEDANIIFGAATDDALEGRIRVSVVATGIDSVMPQQEERPRLVAVGGGAAQAVAGGSVPGPSAPQQEVPAGVPLSVVPTPSGASQSTGLRGPAAMPARMPPAPQAVPAQRPHVVPQQVAPQHAQPQHAQPQHAQPQQMQPQMVPQQQPQHQPLQHQPGPQGYAAPQHEPADAQAEALPHGMAQQQPIPVIDDTPLPRRPIPEHLRQPVGGAGRGRAARPASGGLFADPPAQAAPRRSSLFGIVTGVFRGAPATGAEPAPPPVAAQPQPAQDYRQEPPAVEPQAPSNGERELDIPTFLRRQTSHPAGSNAPQKFVDRQ